MAIYMYDIQMNDSLFINLSLIQLISRNFPIHHKDVLIYLMVQNNWL